jgi:transposase-like protein
MRGNRHSAEEIVNRPREAEVALSKGRAIAEVCKQIGISEQTYYRWRSSMELFDGLLDHPHAALVPLAAIDVPEPNSHLDRLSRRCETSTTG